MISLPQIRAARGLINWTQRQLADAAGLSLRTLSSIELGETVPRLDTLSSIQSAFEAKNVIFGPEDAVKLASERLDIQKFEGPTCMEILMTDVVDQLRWHGGDCYTNGPNEEHYLTLNEKMVDRFYADCFTYKIRDFVLVEKGFSDFISRPSHYRWVSRDILGKLAYTVYHDSVALLTFEKTPRLVIIRNQSIADHFMKQFNSVWAMSQTPTYNRHLAKDEAMPGPWSATRAAAARKKAKKWMATS